jgi:hypothetical protein
VKDEQIQERKAGVLAKIGRGAKRFAGLATELKLALELTSINVNSLWVTGAFKGFMAEIAGGGTGNPVIDKEWNIETVTRIDVGRYRFQLRQTTILGVSIGPLIYFPAPGLYTASIPGTASGVEVVGSPGGVGTFDVQVYALIEQPSGNLQRENYDLLATDELTVVGLMDMSGGKLPRP